MSSRKTLKSVSVEGLKPTITLTLVIEPRGEGYRIHHIKSDSIARDGRDTFVPLRHVSKQKQRIFELEEENAKLRELVSDMWTCIDEGEWDCSACPRHDGCDEGASEFVRRMRECGIEVDE